MSEENHNIDMNAYSLLPTLEESVGDERNVSPKRCYKKEEVYVDALGYQRFRDNDYLVLNTDMSRRKAPGAAKKQGSAVKQTRAERRARRQMELLATKADIKQRDLLKRLANENFDIISEAIDLFDADGVSDDLKWRILAKLIDHAYPKLAVLNTNDNQTDGFIFNIGGNVPIAPKGGRSTADAKKVISLPERMKAN